MNDSIIEGMVGFWGFFTFNFAIYSYFGQAFACMVNYQATAIILSSVFIGLNNFFAGLIVRPQLMIGGFYAIPYYICPLIMFTRAWSCHSTETTTALWCRWRKWILGRPRMHGWHEPSLLWFDKPIYRQILRVRFWGNPHCAQCNLMWLHSPDHKTFELVSFEIHSVWLRRKWYGLRYH